jgi:YVTN family beta-propeller protein
MLIPLWTIVTVLAGVIALANTLGQASAQSADTGPLQLEAKIVLGSVRGRIDHMAVDLKRQRLFVAELGNDSVGVIDLANRILIRTITGLKEPQGVGYESRLCENAINDMIPLRFGGGIGWRASSLAMTAVRARCFPNG